MEPLLITLALIGLAAALLYTYLTWHFGVWKSLDIPALKPKIFLGNFPNAVLGKRHVAYDVDEVYNKYKSKYRALGTFMTRNPELLLLDPKLAHEVMVTSFSKFRNNLSSKWIVSESADKVAARNPFFLKDEEWKIKRGDAIGGLTWNKLSSAYPIWQSCAKKLSAFLKEKTATGNAVIETKNLGLRFTGEAMGDFLWGIDADTFNMADRPTTFLSMAMKMLKQSFVSLSLFYQWNALPVLKRLFNYRFFPAETDHFFSQVTKDAVEARLKDASKADRVDYLNYMLQLKKKKNLSHGEMLGTIMTAMLDGYETSATVAFHTLFYLTKNPETQEKLRAEIQANLGEDGFVAFDTLVSLPYLEQCVHETIRMITPIPMFSRICSEPTELEIASDKRVPIKVGTVVTVPIFAYHHDPEFYPQPYQYKPERFDDGAHAEMNKRGIFMPFGDGPRICLGMRMGLVEVKTFLIEILKAYRVKNCARTIDEKKPDADTFIFGLAGEFWLEYERL